MIVKEVDKIRITLYDSPYHMYASSRIPQLSGYTAVCRGPLVYCFEGVDNDGDVLSLSLKRGGKLVVSAYDTELLGGTVQITAEAVRRETDGHLYSDQPPAEKPAQAVAVPYYIWCNRGENQMRVWMHEMYDNINLPRGLLHFPRGKFVYFYTFISAVIPSKSLFSSSIG